MCNTLDLRYRSSLQDETGDTFHSFEFNVLDGHRTTLTVPHCIAADTTQLHRMLKQRGARLPSDFRKSKDVVRRAIKGGPAEKARFAHQSLEVL
jgi:hypothetical protein